MGERRMRWCSARQDRPHERTLPLASFGLLPLSSEEASRQVQLQAADTVIYDSQAN